MLVFVAFFLAACEVEYIAEPPTAGGESPSGSVPSADGTAIHYQETGTGPVALLFVHCWSCDGGFWKRQVGHFSRTNRVVTLDLAGHGASGKGRTTYTMAAFAEDVVAVVERLRLDRVILIGHSMGGPVVVEAARHRRLDRLVKGVVTVDSFETGFKWPELNRINAFLAPFRLNFRQNTLDMVKKMFPSGSDPVLVTQISEKMAGAPQEVALSAMEQLLMWRVKEGEKSVASLRVPLFHINADPERRAIPGSARVRLIPGAGHFLPQEVPDRFNETLEAVLRDIH
ncbi:MAG: alpha/beta hydrolase [Magnetococcales bacterium]|nr:alpha/beta hydrolase [Magnetococcales bacterium]